MAQAKTMLRNPSYAGHQSALSVVDRRTSLKVSDCRYCGHAVCWTEGRSGRRYPCNVKPKNSEEYGVDRDTLRAYPFEPHRCRPEEVERHHDIHPDAPYPQTR